MTVAININNQTTLVGSHQGYGRSQSANDLNQKRATLLFQQANKQAVRHSFISWLRRRENRLWHLHPNTPLRQTRACQTEKVNLSQIKGSTSNRHQDFDNQFRPLQKHTQARWISIAAHNRHDLPPVELIKVDDVYFVVDGHHRVSVANAMGQSEITANVTVYTVVQPQ